MFCDEIWSHGMTVLPYLSIPWERWVYKIHPMGLGMVPKVASDAIAQKKFLKLGNKQGNYGNFHAQSLHFLH